jgi:uncharacterized membrane protein
MAAVRQRQGRGRLAEVVRVRSFAALGGPVPGAAVAGAVMGWVVSLTPSLLPRSWLVQGIVSGVTAALGYAIGTLASVLLRPLRLRPPQNARSRRWRRLAWRAGAGAVLGSLLFSVRWQQQLALTMGVDGPAGPWLLGVPAVTAALVFLAVVSARAAAALACAVAARAERRAPLGLAALGAAIVIALGLVAAQNLLTRGLLGLTDRSFAALDATLTAELPAPRSARLSGGPGSLTPWDTLGQQGRIFVSRATSIAQLEAFGGSDAIEPIRVYAGLSTAADDAARARSVVAELERTGGFEREVALPGGPDRDRLGEPHRRRSDRAPLRW